VKFASDEVRRQLGIEAIHLLPDHVYVDVDQRLSHAVCSGASMLVSGYLRLPRHANGKSATLVSWSLGPLDFQHLT